MSQNYFQQQSSQTWKIELSGQVFKCKILSAPKFPEAIYVLPKNYFWTRVYISLGWKGRSCPTSVYLYLEFVKTDPYFSSFSHFWWSDWQVSVA